MELPFTLAFDPPSQAAPRAVLRLRRTWLAGLLVLLAIGALRAVFEKASRPAGWMSIPNQDSIRNAMPVRRLCRFLLMLVFAMVPVVPSTTPARLAFAAGGADLATQVVRPEP